MSAICPVCNGTCRAAVPEAWQRYKSVMAGYDAATDTRPCSNCGGQYMMGRPTGRVGLKLKQCSYKAKQLFCSIKPKISLSIYDTETKSKVRAYRTLDHIL